MNLTSGDTTISRKALFRQGSRIWFTRENERRFYFYLTIIMLIIGILYKIGVI
jgi:hypothetical protein